MSTVLVIIVTYNGSAFIEETLLQLGNGLVDVLIVDNASTDGTVELIKESFPHVALIESEKNLGFGAANNMGLRHAVEKGYEYVYLLNQDARISGVDILKMVDLVKENRDFGIVSPLQVNAGEDRLDTGFMNCLDSGFINAFVLGNRERLRDIYEIKPGGMVQAAHWLMPVEALKKTGGFSPSFYHYGEDNNLCARMRFHGFKIGIAVRFHGIHDRENRSEGSFGVLYKNLQRWKCVKLDPNLTARDRFNVLSELISRTFIIYRWPVIPYILSFFRLLSRLRKERESYGKGGLFL